MARFIVELESGTAPQAIAPQAAQVQGVVDVAPSRATNALLVSGEPEAKRELRRLPNVSAVHEDIQAFPQVADPEEVGGFLERVREERGEQNVPPTFQTEPAPAGDNEPVPDGGQARLPVVAAAEPAEPSAGPIGDASASIDQLGVPSIHEQGVTGESVISVVVDTGVCGDQISPERQMDGTDLTKGDNPWDTAMGDHGSMSGGIMAGGPETAGIETGVLPDSRVFPIKSTLAASEIIQAQDVIIELAEDNPDMHVVVNNSWAFTECSGICDHPVTDAIRNAARRPGVYQVFAAGNQAELCGQDCTDVGISGPNSLDDVLTVGASGRNGAPTDLHSYSSRGGASPSCGTNKPDVTAPIFGTVPWGCGKRNLGNGVGTSAAAPDVAGLVGLVVDQAGGRPDQQAVFDAIRDTAMQFEGSGHNGCTGRGNVTAAAAEEGPTRAPITAGSAVVGGAGLAAGIGGALLRERLRR